MSVETAAAGQSISPLRHRKDRLESDLGLMKTNPTELAEGCESAASAQVVLESRIDSSPQKPMVTLRDDPGPIRTEPAVQEGAGRPSTDTAQVLTEFSTYNPPGNTFSSAPFERETGSPEREPGRNNPGPPVVRVTIGRIDVRVVAPAATTEPRRGAARPPTIMSLDKYLKQGNGRQR